MNATLKQLKAQMVLPVIAAPMFLVSSPAMVIAAAKAGILGAFPAPNARTIEDLQRWFEEISGALDPSGKPWAFNMITHSSYGRFEEEIELVRTYKPRLVITALGGPHRVVDAVHSYNGLVFADVNSPTFAKKAIDKGADGLVLVCSGAGGHTGEYAMLPFIDEVRRFFDGPLIAGGGISHGTAVRAVETLGVDFAYLGTRFLTATESLISQPYRQMVWDSQMEDIVASRAITGALGNWMRASLQAAGLSEEKLRTEGRIDFSGDMQAGTKAWKNVWSAGQGLGAVSGPETVAEIVAQLLSQYEQAVARQANGVPYLTASMEAAE